MTRSLPWPLRRCPAYIPTPRGPSFYRNTPSRISRAQLNKTAKHIIPRRISAKTPSSYYRLLADWNKNILQVRKEMGELRKDNDAIRKETDAIRKETDAIREEMAKLEEEGAKLKGEVAECLDKFIFKTKAQVEAMRKEQEGIRKKLEGIETILVLIADPEVLRIATEEFNLTTLFQKAIAIATASPALPRLEAPPAITSTASFSPSPVSPQVIPTVDPLAVLLHWVDHLNQNSEASKRRADFIHSNGDWTKIIHLLAECAKPRPPPTKSDREIHIVNTIEQVAHRLIPNQVDAERLVSLYAKSISSPPRPSRNNALSIRLVLILGQRQTKNKTHVSDKWAKLQWLWKEMTGRQNFEFEGLSEEQLNCILSGCACREY
ncbi:hypothetical protein MKEN_01039400 [Mycena kentingensis (nom. inval.)]|nr:hypothetical protein MKEN_01039400 [Mycena kentingensis (nom. inval.)]